MPMIPVKYAGRLLAELDLDGKDRDARVSACAGALHEVLGRDPKPSDPAEPEVPWPIVVVRELCSAADAEDADLGADVLHRYVRDFRMDRILACFVGKDMGRVLEVLEQARSRGV